jgi:shikimate kinase
MKIVLLGYMASGKSAVGRALAKVKNLDFIDLDAYIEEREQISISEIFELKGEIYFRKKEHEYLKELLNIQNNCIISLGGGTPCYGNNMELIKNSAISFYLKASIATIFNRLKNETSQRPLVANIGIDNLQEYIAKHLFERNPFYEKANYTIIINDKSIVEICSDINLKLHTHC